LIYRFITFVLPGLCLLATPLWAQTNDARLHVVIPQEDMQNARSDTSLANIRSSDTKLALHLALPKLWDRIVPQAERFQADAITPNYGLVARIVPSDKQTIIEFNGKAVFRTLGDNHIPAIVLAPRFHLVLQVRNSAGLEMSQTQTLLMQEAKDFSSKWGIDLADNAPSLIIVWQWLDNQRVMFSLRGNSRLQEFSETRVITDADPLVALSEWLRNILIKARDAYAFDTDNQEDIQTPNTLAGQQIILTIDRKSSLMAQVALEDGLGNDPRIRQVLPVSLGVARQRYLLQLERSDISWLPEWFERRGYRLAVLPGGEWLAQ